MRYGPRVRLRAITRDDLPTFVRWFNDPEVTEYLIAFWPFSLEDENRWFEEMLARPRYERPLAIEIPHEGGWRLIGNLGFHHIDWRVRSAMVGIVIGEKDCWDKGYGREALTLLLDMGFGELNLHRIWLQVHADHPRAIAAYRKVGFVEEGRLRDAEFRAGRYKDVLIMSILAPEWAARAQGSAT